MPRVEIKGGILTHCHKENHSFMPHPMPTGKATKMAALHFLWIPGYRRPELLPVPEWSLRKGRFPGENDKGHSASHDTGHCNLLKHVKQVGHA